MKFLLDTDTCIYIINGRIAPLEDRVSQGCCISPVVLGELLYGAAKSDRVQFNRRRVEVFAATVNVVPLTAEVAASYGELRVWLEQRGLTIGVNDLWIAAHAKSLGCALVTNNQREFSRVPDLPLANWLDP